MFKIFKNKRLEKAVLQQINTANKDAENTLSRNKIALAYIDLITAKTQYKSNPTPENHLNYVKAVKTAERKINRAVGQ